MIEREGLQRALFLSRTVSVLSSAENEGQAQASAWLRTSSLLWVSHLNSDFQFPVWSTRLSTILQHESLIRSSLANTFQSIRNQANVNIIFFKKLTFSQRVSKCSSIFVTYSQTAYFLHLNVRNLLNLKKFKCKQHFISEKAMAPHSSTLAWKIPWTEEPGRLPSMGSLRVGHD